MRARAVVMALALAAPAAAEVAGTPAAPRPGPLPLVWLGWSNDAFGGEVGDNTDDFRTSAFTGNLAVDRWVLVLDHSTLTAKQGLPPARSDEFTATLGWLAVPGSAAAAEPGPWLAIGAGARWRGDLGGEAIQNGWHDAIGVAEVDYLAYEESGCDGVGYLAGGGWIALPFLPHGDRIALDGRAALLATTDGKVQGEVEARLVARGRDGAVWFGGRGVTVLGSEPGIAARAVSDHEEGAWLVYGAGFGGWFVDAGISPADNASLGRIGWEWGRATPAARDLDGALDADLGVYQGLSLGVTLRWRPGWLARLPSGRWFSLLGEYRFGRTGQEWPGNTVVFRQGGFGAELARPAGGRSWQWQPFIAGDLGMREERVVEELPQTRYRPESAITGVAHGSAGVRLLFPDHPGRTVRYGLGLAVEGWLPFESERIENALESSRYNIPGWAAGMTLTAGVDW